VTPVHQVKSAFTLADPAFTGKEDTQAKDIHQSGMDGLFQGKVILQIAGELLDQIDRGEAAGKQAILRSLARNSITGGRVSPLVTIMHGISVLNISRMRKQDLLPEGLQESYLCLTKDLDALG
jgi:hypothetical protein